MNESMTKYEKFFNSALDKFGVKSPAELDDEKKKEFFNYVDDNFKGKNESTKAYGKALVTIARDRKLKSISKKDRDTLMKIAQMMKQANEIKEDKAAYEKFFNSALSKFGVDSPAELDDDKKKEFFNYVDDNYKGVNESEEMLKYDAPRFETYKLFLDKALKKAGIKVRKFKPMKRGWVTGKWVWGGFYTVVSKDNDVLPFYIDKKGYIDLGVSSEDWIIGRLDKFQQVVKNLKDFKKSDLSDSVVRESGIMYRAGVKKYGKEGMKKIQQAAGKKLGHAEIGKIKDRYEKKKKEGVHENINKRAKVKEVYKWMKTLEEYRYRKVPAVDVRRVTSFINNGIKEDELPESLKKKWQFAEYGKEKHLANKFLKTRKIKESVSEGRLSSKIKKAIMIAIQMSGNMTGAVAAIEKIKKGLSKDKKVYAALRLANEAKNKGLWHNIHAKRKRGEKPAKPGDPNYPETLDIEEGSLTGKIKKAVQIAIKMSGNMTGAVDKIEKLAKGLSDDDKVAAALRLANESVTESSEFTMKIDSYQNAMNALDKYVDVLKKLGLKKKSTAALKLLKNLQKIMFQKEIKEVSKPLVDKLYHAIDDVEELIGATNSDEADDAFEKLKPSKKALVASLKLLNKVR